MIERTASLSTSNKHLDQEIEVELTLTVPEDIGEAISFFGGEEKLLSAIQSEVQNRKLNTARPVLRDAKVEGDFQTMAQSAAEAYQPGRRGGFQKAKVSQDAVAAAAEQGTEALLALLQAQGVELT